MNTRYQNTVVNIEWDIEQITSNFDHTIHKVLMTIKHHQIKHLRLDFQGLGDYLPVNMQHYAITNWLPQLPLCGLQSLIIVVPRKSIGQAAIRNIFIHNNQQVLPITFLD